MTVYLVESAPQRLRGMLARYCLEIRAGVFVGRIDARLREKLWEHVEHHFREGGNAVLIWRVPSEQGYTFRTIGDARRQPVQKDGLWLIDFEL